MTTTRILFIRARGPQRDGKLTLGMALEGRDGWRFNPFTSTHKGSRKAHATWEQALARFPETPEFA